MKKLTIAMMLILAATAFVAMGCGGDGDDCPAGTLTCDCLANQVCNAGLTCNAQGKCEAEAACCAAGSGMVHVIGAVKDVTTQQGVVADVGPIAPMQFITGASTSPINSTTSAADGTFTTDCFDASGIALGLVVLSDDVGFDGVGGTYFPTGTGVKGWGNAIEEKVCVESAAVFAVPNTLVTGLGAIPGFDAAGNGFAMGFVLTAAGQPVEGAVVKKADGTDLSGVLYPNPTFTDFTGAATSATGMYLVLDFPSVTSIKPEKAGMTWDADGFSAATLPGYCYFLNMPAE